MVETPLAVFVSCATPHTPAQEEFLSAVEACLKARDCDPQIVGRTKFSVRQPVEAARELIGECDGAVVIAFERTKIIEALEKPNSPQQKEVKNELHPTVWNQMEAAMAYAQDVPILTLVERGLRRQGMLSDRLEWTAIEETLSPQLLQTERFRQVFSKWLKLVQSRQHKPKVPDLDLEKMRVGQLVALLNAKQAWACAAAVLGVLVTTSAFSFKVGQWSNDPRGAGQRVSAAGPSGGLSAADGRSSGAGAAQP